ncbi:GDSL esterase/lipase [Acorus calamus]|uniref:GDSL esterase/lipase n=1 Tax=Acorus calamus TaxID=4465 RepID=A0AAV9FJ21_ACOCL|nr:GDSL esterase/lipase [Acorus calamus]
MHRLGATKIAVVGIPPIGCMPITKTLVGTTQCDNSYNQAAISFNSKLIFQLVFLEKQLGIRTSYIDVYGVLMEAMNNPSKYGFTETTKGCVGSGVIEIGESCIGAMTCKDPSRYVFWDAVHPTQKMYSIIAYKAISKVLSQDETPLLYSLVCGEGVVNDAMSIVLFKIVQDFDLVHIDTGVAFQVVGNFIHLFLTSTILGVIVGLLSVYIIKKIVFWEVLDLSVDLSAACAAAEE